MSETYDIILVLPYRFSDHPSFPEGILKRVLEYAGFRVGWIETPLWQDPDSFKILGRPRLFFAIVPGPVDSVVLNYTASRRRRREDLYQSGGSAYFPDSARSASSRIRPDRSVMALSNQIRKAWKGVHIISGGMETTLRTLSHFDFQQERIRRSILLDARLDLAVMGMGEHQIVAIARAMRKGTAPNELCLPGTARIMAQHPPGNQWEDLPCFEAVQKDPSLLLELQRGISRAASRGYGYVQQHAERFVVVFPHSVYSTEDLDRIYDLPYERCHPEGTGRSPALTMNLFSITSHRGCAGACAFCSISRHQGRQVISRSPESVMREVETLSHHPAWKGIVPDVGGATAEMYGMDHPTSSSTSPYLNLLREVRSHHSVRQVFVGSGVRHDLMLRQPDLLEEIMRHHCGKFLRVAPEHTHDDVLSLMGKPRFDSFRNFSRLFHSINRSLKRKIELAAYIVIGHPGEEDAYTRDMAGILEESGVHKVDAQIFTPSPGTLSTAMYVSGQDPGGKSIPVCRDIHSLERRKARLYGQKKIRRKGTS